MKCKSSFCFVCLLKERVGASVPGVVAVQHQCAIQCLRQVLLRSALAGRGQQPQLPSGTAQQGQSPEARGQRSPLCDSCSTQKLQKQYFAKNYPNTSLNDHDFMTVFPPKKSASIGAKN